MLRRRIIETLIAHQEGLTLVELERALGVPRTMIRTALLPEFFDQCEIDHPKYGRQTAWVVKPSLVRLDGNETYSVPVAKVEEPVHVIPEQGGIYNDPQRAGLHLLVQTIKPNRIEGILLADHGSSFLHFAGRDYGTDNQTFRKVWTEEVPNDDSTNGVPVLP